MAPIISACVNVRCWTYYTNRSLRLHQKERSQVILMQRSQTRINELVCAMIWSCLFREQKYPFMRETSAYKLWKELADKVMKKSLENKLHMRMKLYCFQYLPGTTMSDHITRFESLVTDLLNLVERINDVEKALILLASL